MKYTKLGKSDLTVSRICMGCMGFGNAATGQHSWTVDETQTRDIIRHGLDLGINFFDTAIAYQNGTSEQYVGRALRDFAKRDDVVVATKFTPRTQEEIDAGVSGQKHIEACLNQSLQTLGMDYVDLYIYHKHRPEHPGDGPLVPAGRSAVRAVSAVCARRCGQRPVWERKWRLRRTHGRHDRRSALYLRRRNHSLAHSMVGGRHRAIRRFLP